MDPRRPLRRAAGLLIVVLVPFAISGCIPIGIKGQSRLVMGPIGAHVPPPSPPPRAADAS
jgi:hypothetical protein